MIFAFNQPPLAKADQIINVFGGIVSGVLTLGIATIISSQTCDTGIAWGCSGEGGATDTNSDGRAEVPLPSSLTMTQSESDYCTDEKPQPTLSWTYNGGVGAQSAYEIDISRDGTTGTIFHSTGKVPSGSHSYVVPNNILEYARTYHWRLRVWDANDSRSGFASSQFNTRPHRGPKVNFTWEPANPARGATTTLTDASQLYGGASVSSYNWTFPSNTTLLTPPASNSTERIKFSQSAPKQGNTVRLSVTDSDSLTCEGSKNLNLIDAVIDFKEVQ